MPNEIGLRNLTYSASLYVDVTKTILRNNEVHATTLYKKIYIGKIPIMIKSRYCLLPFVRSSSDENKRMSIRSRWLFYYQWLGKDSNNTREDGDEHCLRFSHEKR